MIILNWLQNLVQHTWTCVVRGPAHKGQFGLLYEERWCWCWTFTAQDLEYTYSQSLSSKDSVIDTTASLCILMTCLLFIYRTYNTLSTWLSRLATSLDMNVAKSSFEVLQPTTHTVYSFEKVQHLLSCQLILSCRSSLLLLAYMYIVHFYFLRLNKSIVLGHKLGEILQPCAPDVLYIPKYIHLGTAGNPLPSTSKEHLISPVYCSKWISCAHGYMTS